MNVKELKAYLDVFPDNNTVQLIDTSSDDPYETQYGIEVDDIYELDVTDEPESNEVTGKGVFIGFFNKMNPYPVNSKHWSKEYHKFVDELRTQYVKAGWGTVREALDNLPYDYLKEYFDQGLTPEQAMIANSTDRKCPKCGVQVLDPIEGKKIIHDVENCKD